MWQKIKKIIQHNHHFLITTHLNPDGDGIGSACALMELLRAMGKQVRFVVDSPIAVHFSFLDYHKAFFRYDTKMDMEDVRVLIVLDTHRLQRIGRLASLIKRPQTTAICIDHHLPSTTFTTHTIVDTRACSTGGMIYTLYKEMGYPLNLEAATGIYTSVISDTGRFSYASTSRKAHKLADECIKLGVDPKEMHRHLFQQVPINALPLFCLAIGHSEFFFHNRLMIQAVKRCDYEPLGIDIADLDYLHEFNKSLRGVDCFALLRELPNKKVRISLRSSVDSIEVAEAMKFLGGGGHSKASGATISASLQDAKMKLLHLLQHQFS